jgi:hypothetical protein
MSEATKHDGDKCRLELLPPELLFAVGDILAFGAKKYEARDWEKGMDWSRVFGALMRHMWAWWRGESADAETGKSHLWHAGCCIAFLIAYEERKIGRDDRPKKTDPQTGKSPQQEPPDYEQTDHFCSCLKRWVVACNCAQQLRS